LLLFSLKSELSKKLGYMFFTGDFFPYRTFRSIDKINHGLLILTYKGEWPAIIIYLMFCRRNTMTTVKSSLPKGSITTIPYL